MELYLYAALTALGIPLLTALVAWATEVTPAPPRPRALNQDTTTRAAWITTGLWAVLTVAGLAAVLTVDFYSTVGSDKGEEIAGAFRFLTALAVPVAALVVSVLVYSVLRRGSSDLPPEDGMYLDGKNRYPWYWLVGTAGLTLLIIIYPGLWTLGGIIADHDDPDLVIQVEALQWTWLVSYPEHGIENQTELLIPVNREVTFQITSRDVLHSFWVPAFLMKIDAIPGHTTTMSLVATELGDYSDEPVYRLQCAELCGVSHSRMRIPVRVVSQSEFDGWIKQKTVSR